MAGRDWRLPPYSAAHPTDVKHRPIPDNEDHVRRGVLNPTQRYSGRKCLVPPCVRTLIPLRTLPTAETRGHAADAGGWDAAAALGAGAVAVVHLPDERAAAPK